MSIDRRIDLDVGLSQRFPSPQLDQPGTGLTPNGGETADADREAFQRAMAGEGKDPAAGGKPGDARPDTAPFALFAAVPVGGAGAAPAAAAAPGGLSAVLAASAEQLLVRNGEERREVRVDLKDDVFPGVSVAVYEDEGRVVAAFTCANENSRERLVAAAPALAEELAGALARGTLVQVQTDDPDDRCLIEARAEARA